VATNSRQSLWDGRIPGVSTKVQTRSFIWRAWRRQKVTDCSTARGARLLFLSFGKFNHQSTRYVRSRKLLIRRTTVSFAIADAKPAPGRWCRTELIRSMKLKVVILNSAAVAVALLVSAATWAAPAAKDEVIPLIEMENTPLSDALRQLARKAHLNILLDPKLSQPPSDSMMVSIRWQDVTAREALNALLDNYGLVLVESPRWSRSR